ncbi:MAG TPA: hypothetical protein VEC57_17210 [Candidatus Limnocylindrales bacterium]|nr:hypothetical protein [Candidatus Limnocylindrales bacterium]
MRRLLLTAAAIMLMAVPAAAAAPAADICEAAKNQLAGKYAKCIAAAEKAHIRSGNGKKYAKDLEKCASDLAVEWEGREQAAGGQCPTSGDDGQIQNFLDACMQSVAEEVGGGDLGLDPVTCNAALAGAASCDAGALPPGIPSPVCPDAVCDQQCDPLDTGTCVLRGNRWHCDPPSCTCGTTNASTTCTLPPPVCDPICEPPNCGISCGDDQCGDQACPTCQGICGEARCYTKCNNWPSIHPCGSTFGCFVDTPTCTTTCRPPLCYWLDRESSGTPPVCEAAVPGDFREIAGKNGIDCSAVAGSQERDWAILCEAPECEISCEDMVSDGCSSTAECEVDCTDPICEVTCDTPQCTQDGVTGATVCNPPQNCTTACSCRLGVCTRSQ